MDVPATMHAAVTLFHGGPDAIEARKDWPTPTPGDGEALVRVRAAALNNTDIWSREGAYGTAADPDAIVGWRGVPLEFPLIQGIDIAGEVVAVGAGVADTWVGRRALVDPVIEYVDDSPARIAGSESGGGFAEYHLCRLEQLHDVSGSQPSDLQLACLPCAYGTALGMINRAECEPGERVVVTGASGGVGLAALQLLVARGCQVVARTSPANARQIAQQ
ncbi:MAG: alcohol dehydrogenase catalytic domain-containing protein, partial [Microthrixaceae bacterium]